MGSKIKTRSSCSIECVIITCKKRLDCDTPSDAEEAGWKGLQASQEKSNPYLPYRTHIGWCPACGIKFGVKS